MPHQPQLYKISHFKKGYPILYSHFNFLSEKEFEKENINATRRTASKCDYESTIKLIYLDPPAIHLDFVKDKHSTLVEIVRNAKEKDKAYVTHNNYLKRFDKAKRGIYPFPGNKANILNVERQLLTEEFIRTVIEIQDIKKQIDCSSKSDIHIFERDSEFWEAVKEVKMRVYKKQEPKWIYQKEDEIMDMVEELLIAEICDDKPSNVAKQILADEYAVDSSTIGKKLLPGVSKKLTNDYPNIPANKAYMEDLIEKGTEEHVRRKQKKDMRLF